MADRTVDWAAIDADPSFQELHQKKKSFIWGLMIFSPIYYFLLPIGGGYFPELFSVRVWGPVNVGILFAFSQFVVAWIIAAIYAVRDNREFDRLATEIRDDAECRGIVKHAERIGAERNGGGGRA